MGGRESAAHFLFWGRRGARAPTTKGPGSLLGIEEVNLALLLACATKAVALVARMRVPRSEPAPFRALLRFFA